MHRQLIAKHFGLNPEKEIKLLAVGPNEARLAALDKAWSLRQWSRRRGIFMRRSWVFML